MKTKEINTSVLTILTMLGILLGLAMLYRCEGPVKTVMPYEQRS